MPSLTARLIEALTSERNIPEIIEVEKPWGYELVLHVEDAYVKFIQVEAGERTSLQFHPLGEEAVIIIEGSGTVEGTEDDELGRPRPSPAYRIVPGQTHRSVGPVVLLEVTGAGPDDIIRLEDDHGRATEKVPE